MQTALHGPASHVKSLLQLNKEALSGDQTDLTKDSWFISWHNSLQIDADPAFLDTCSVGWPGPPAHATSAASTAVIVISSQQGRAAVQKVQLSMLCCQLTRKSKILHHTNHWNKNKVHSTFLQDDRNCGRSYPQSAVTSARWRHRAAVNAAVCGYWPTNVNITSCHTLAFWLCHYDQTIMQIIVLISCLLLSCLTVKSFLFVPYLEVLGSPE